MLHFLRIFVLLSCLGLGVFSCGSNGLQNFSLLQPDTPNAQTGIAGLPGLSIELSTQIFNNASTQSRLIIRLQNEQLSSGRFIKENLGPNWILRIGNLQAQMIFDEESQTYENSDLVIDSNELAQLENASIEIVNESSNTTISSSNASFISSPVDFSSVTVFSQRSLFRCDPSQIDWASSGSDQSSIKIDIFHTRLDSSASLEGFFEDFSDDGLWSSERITGNEPEFSRIFEELFSESEKALPIATGTVQETLRRSSSSQSIRIQQQEVFSLRLDLVHSRTMQRSLLYEASCL